METTTIKICGDTDVRLRHIKTDKPFLVDVPVRVAVWIRPENQRKQFEILKQARPSILFVTSDGGRNEKEWAAIRENRKMFEEEIDWCCDAYFLFEDHNNGLYTMGGKCRELIWSVTDRCIFLEDDILPAISFFQYCAELLERYKDDTRISTICGMNHLGTYEEPQSDYFFSRQGAVWGTATWKRVHDMRDGIHYGNDPYVMKLLRQRTRHNQTFWDKIVGYTKDGMYDGHVPGGEFYSEFAMYGHNQLKIIPKRNMICNIGCDDNSAHAKGYRYFPKVVKQLFHMKTYELDGEIKHPKYVIPDVFYEKKRNHIMAYNDKTASMMRNIECTWLRLKYDGPFKWIAGVLKRRFRRKKVIEK